MDQKYWDTISWFVYLGLPTILFLAIIIDAKLDGRLIMPWRRKQ